MPRILDKSHLPLHLQKPEVDACIAAGGEVWHFPGPQGDVLHFHYPDEPSLTEEEAAAQAEKEAEAANADPDAK